MQLFYDNIVFALQRFGGISTYWYELTTRALKEHGNNIHFFETGLEGSNILRPLLPIEARNITTLNRGGIFLERFRRIPITSLKEDAIFHSSYFRVPQKKAKMKKVCTVHDFIHDKFHSKPRIFLHNFSKKRAIEESDAIITVSHHTKRDLLEYYPRLNPDIIFPIYNGGSENFKLIPGLATYDIAPYFLYVGGREKYKNFDFALELVSHKKDFQLYIVGKPLNKEEDRIVKARLGNRYKLFSNISVEQLNQVYNKAFCLLYPSNYEGFGIPLLEAMQTGCPFIALNTSSIPEVAGPAGFLLSALDIEEGLNAINYIEDNYKLIQQTGFKQATLFSWDKCYTQTQAVYNSLTGS